MSVHRTVRRLRREQPGLGRVVEHELEGLRNHGAVATAVRQMTVRHECECAERRDSDVLSIPTASEGTIRVLDDRERCQPLANRLVAFRRDLFERRCVLRTGAIDLDLDGTGDVILAEGRPRTEEPERGENRDGMSCSLTHRSASSAILR